MPMNKSKISKPKVVFDGSYEVNDPIISSAMLTQLMVTITQIGIRVDNLMKDDAIMVEEKEYGKE